MSQQFYVALKDCGHAVAGILLNNKTRVKAANEMAGWIKDGFEARRMSADEAGKCIVECECIDKNNPQQALAFEGESGVEDKVA
jgi:hypothetical protein